MTTKLVKKDVEFHAYFKYGTVQEISSGKHWGELERKVNYYRNVKHDE